jgi:hypothetical protein
MILVNNNATQLTSYMHLYIYMYIYICIFRFCNIRYSKNHIKTMKSINLDRLDKNVSPSLIKLKKYLEDKHTMSISDDTVIDLLQSVAHNFAEEAIDLIKNGSNSNLNFVNEESNYRPFLSMQPALDVINDTLQDATIDLKEKILELLQINNIIDLLWQLLAYIYLNYKHHGISISISILNTLKLLKSSIPNKVATWDNILNIVVQHSINDSVLELSVPAMEFLQSQATTSQLMSCIDTLRSAMLKGTDRLISMQNKALNMALSTKQLDNNKFSKLHNVKDNSNNNEFQLIDLKIRQLACILFSEEWKDSENVQEYMKLFSSDGRTIKILRQALLSPNKVTVRLGMDIIYIILNAGKTSIPELSYFPDSWGISNRDINNASINMKAEHFEKVKMMEEMLESKIEELEDLRFKKKKERDSFEQTIFELKASHEDALNDKKKELRKANERLKLDTNRFEETLKHKDSVINLKEQSFSRAVEQADNLRNERNVAERESGLLRRKLRALEKRIDEVAKQLLESLESGAEEVAKRDRKLQQIKYSHNVEIENIKKQNISSFNKLKLEMEENMANITKLYEMKNTEVEKLKEKVEFNEDIAIKKDKEHDNVVKQLVTRLNKMIIAYEKK